MNNTFTNIYATVIAHYEGYAICEDDFGDLLYAEIPEEFAELGTVIELCDLEELDTLPADLQNEIRQRVSEIPESVLEYYRTGAES